MKDKMSSDMQSHRPLFQRPIGYLVQERHLTIASSFDGMLMKIWKMWRDVTGLFHRLCSSEP
jgi:hypothetical protein